MAVAFALRGFHAKPDRVYTSQNTQAKKASMLHKSSDLAKKPGPTIESISCRVFVGALQVRRHTRSETNAYITDITLKLLQGHIRWAAASNDRAS